MKQPNKEPEQDKTTYQPQRPTNSDEQAPVKLPEQFELMGTLGQGGMGTVYKARNKYTERVVAIKILSANSISEEVLLRFQREAKAIAKLEHPNVVSLFDFGVAADGSPYCVMEFTKGRDLGQILRDKGPLPEAKVVDIFVQVCAALNHAHQQGIIHRDLKPSNIILAEVTTGNYKAKVLDFGIAKLAESDDPATAAPGAGNAPAHKLTKTGFIVGTPLYMSPEQCEGGKIDGRSDIYAIGAVMYECLCGAPPHQGASAIETMLLRMSEEPLTFKDRGVTVDPTMEEIVRKCLKKDPAERWASTSQLSDALAAKRPKKVKPNAPPIVIDKRISLGVLGAIALFGLYSLIAPHITQQISEMHYSPTDLHLQHLLNEDKVHVKTSYVSDLGMKLLSSDDKLLVLDLSHWKGMPDSKLVYLEKLPLKSLNLEDTGVSDKALDTVAKIKSLEELNLAGTKIDSAGVEKILSALPELHSLNLSSTKVDRKALYELGRDGEKSKLENIGLGGLPKIIHGNDLNDLQHLPVSVWDFSGDDIDDADIDTITRLQSTKSLNLDNNPKITAAALTKLAQLPRLERLSLAGSSLKAADILNFRTSVRGDNGRIVVVTPNEDDRLKDRFKKTREKNPEKITELDLQGKNISNDVLVVMGQPTARYLSNLSLAKCYEVGDAGVAQLKNLPLERLNLDSTSITDASIKVIANLANLYELSMADTKVRDLAELSNLSGLNSLNLSLVKNVTSVPALSRMKQLRKLIVAGTDQASARMFLAMLKTSKVVDCNFAKCGLDDSDVDAIAQATQLRRIDLSENDISGAAILKLANLPELEILRVKKCPRITAGDIAQFTQQAGSHKKIETGQ